MLVAVISQYLFTINANTPPLYVFLKNINMIGKHTMVPKVRVGV